MALQMTTIMGMEIGTRSSIVEAITEMGRASTTLEEQLQLALLLLEGVQLHQLLHLAKLCSPDHIANLALSCHAGVLKHMLQNWPALMKYQS